MITQKKQATLYLVPTPIGNLEDITFRAVRILNEVDYIFAEDTRVTKVLLSHFNITNPQLESYHIFNEESVCERIISLLNDGLDIAIVSDAGTPSISDPGYLITRTAIKKNFNVVSLPGASSLTTALSGSGLPSNEFSFFGFIPHRKTRKETFFQSVKDRRETIVFFDSPHRIIETLQIIFEVLGDREMVIARELTKRYEEYIRGNVSQILQNHQVFKGEMVIIVSGAANSTLAKELNDLSIKEHFFHYVSSGLSKKDAQKQVARDRGVSKSEIYKELLK